MDLSKKILGNFCSIDSQIQNPISQSVNSLIYQDQIGSVLQSNLHQQFQDAWESVQLQQAQMQQVWQDPLQLAWADTHYPQQNLHQQAWVQSAPTQSLTPQQQAKFQQIWDAIQTNNPQQAYQQWNQLMKSQDTYQFTYPNPYLGTQNAYQKALQMLQQRETVQSILLLESEVQTNQFNSQAWTLLGKLHLYNDQDEKSIQANKIGLVLDPYNLPLLMNLGICLTNQHDWISAQNYLKMWIQHHPDYNSIEIQQRNLRESLKSALNTASMINPQDAQVFQALGVLFYLDGDYQNAEDVFLRAVNLNPKDPSLWNKLGATQSKQGKMNQGLHSYYQALELKPDYVRTWVNIGISYYNLTDYKNAARFYLCGLSLNPHAIHIKTLLTTLFVNVGREDLLEKLGMEDVMAFADEFDIITRTQLPKSSLKY